MKRHVTATTECRERNDWKDETSDDCRKVDQYV